MDVHLRDLRYFVAVAEHLHFTEAAEALYVSQPALSKQIRALETQLRTPLFVRDRRGVQLTPAGCALLPAAREVLAAWSRAEDVLASAAADSEATLVIGMSTGLGRGLLPAIRARFAETAPGVRLVLRQVGWEDVTAGLDAEERQRTDAAFVWLPLTEPERFEWVPVAVEPRLVALPESHPLAAREEIDFVDLLGEPFLALPKDSGPARDHWLAVEARGGAPAVIGGEVASTEETVEALASGLGVCLVAEGNAVLVTRDGIVTRPVRGLGPSTLALAWRRGDDRPLLRAFRAVLPVLG
ncbi:LysR family transcriptional regulator [Allokutzneria albata]|uniref:DNA-binding transcriptional regulator, LysR family n=1 Tax=Allokutzneria albata TaxID=211114 RepID=A0A1G9T8T2_ALLAB|nr:LysR family transcriptional regulator [Allokutzneria albata]SDM44067.1 DNA-binding transcriptional regulator, LysR family [Allokutzneria albata]